MKAHITFNLPDEREEFDTMMKAQLYHSMLRGVYDYQRNLRKYDEREMIPRDEIVEHLILLIDGFEM